MIADISLWTSAASTTARSVDMLFFFLMAVCGTVGLLVAVLLIYFCIRYRRGTAESGSPRNTDEPHLLEWFWTISPLGIFAVMFAWGGQVYLSAYSPPEDATPIYVVAKQWMWKFQHPEGQREIDTLHVPMGKPIKLLLISEDVIHSFFVPAFRIHMDVLPQRYTSVWFQATAPGEYHLFCSQFCGTNHSGMVGRVIVMGASDYQQWLNFDAEGSLALRGRQVFLQYRCLSCHSADANARAPVLENVFGRMVALDNGTAVRADHNYLREAILHPSAQIVAGYRDIMPPFDGQITEEQVLALIAYIQSLKTGETPRRVETYPPPAKTQPDATERKNP
jgi:cytochrome c oxidase subunit 2